VKILTLVAVSAGLAVATPVLAQDAAPEAATASVELRSGLLLFSAEGRRVGRIDSLVGDRNAPTAVRVIAGSKLVTVPADTISAGDKPTRVNTSLSFKEIR